MPVPVHTIKQGALEPSLSVQFIKSDGTPQDITGATVSLTAWVRETKAAKIASASMTITDAATGKAQYPFAAPDTDTAQVLEGYAQAVLTGARTLRAPSAGLLYIAVTRST